MAQQSQNQGSTKKTAPKQTSTKKSGSKIPALKGVVNDSLARIQTLRSYGALKVPADYSPENAVRSAAFIINDLKDKDKKPVLESCTKESIANSLMEMVVQGLNPMKHQCSFIPRGNKLTMQREYAGTITLAKRYGGVQFVIPRIIYEGDTFEYRIDTETGFIAPTKHEQSIENIDINKIKGAYAYVHNKHSDKPYVELMTIDMIRAAWNQGDMKGQSPAHKNFTDQMVKKTVISRACKLFINSSSDAPLVEDNKDQNKEAVQEEIGENANKEPLDISMQDGAEIHADGTTGQSTEEKEETPEGEPEKAEPSSEGSQGKQENREQPDEKLQF